MADETVKVGGIRGLSRVYKFAILIVIVTAFLAVVVAILIAFVIILPERPDDTSEFRTAHRWESKLLTPHAACVFPFTYNGTEYVTCTSVDRDYPWCLTSDGHWRYCAPVTELRGKCHIPFEYDNALHHHCIRTRDRYKRSWCSQTAVYSGSWSHCVPAKRKNPKCVEWFKKDNKWQQGCIKVPHTPHIRKCSVKTEWNEDESHECIYQKLMPAKECVFPFHYRGKDYYDCTGIHCKHGWWCGTTRNYEYGMWEYCIDTTVTPFERCNLPFVEKGKLYHRCTLDYGTRYWCKEGPDYALAYDCYMT